MSSYNKKKNLVRSPDEYNRYYGGFRGVDFSSDHTQVHEQRLSYAINMYKDYRNGEGNSVETIPGFRRRFEALEGGKINGIHDFEFVTEKGEREKEILIHSAEKLYIWKSYPEKSTANVMLQKSLVLHVPNDYDTSEDIICEWGVNTYKIKYIEVNGTTYQPSGVTLSADQEKIIFNATYWSRYAGATVIVDYIEDSISPLNGVKMNDAESKSFTFNNRLYILDGEHFFVYYRKSNGESVFEEVKDSEEGVYIPTTYKGIGTGDAAPVTPEDFNRIEYEQKNLLCRYFKHSYVISTQRMEIYNPETGQHEIKHVAPESVPIYDNAFEAFKVFLYGVEVPSDEYTYDKDGLLDFNKELPLPTDPSFEGKYDETYPGLVIEFDKGEARAKADADIICKSTVVASFDKRIFVSGHPDPRFSNRLSFCGINNATGLEDATYWGELDYVVDGVENAPITGLIPVGDTLAVLKNYAKQDGSIYFHTRTVTNNHITPITYQSAQGLSGYNCLGACINFLDDPIFISPVGVQAIGKLTLSSERAVEHRSTLIDAKLTNMLRSGKAQFVEWSGYLVLLVNGCLFMADSRQTYTSELGTMQYEWYYIEGVGVYEDQEKEYYYSPVLYDEYPDEIVYNDVKYPVELAKRIYNYDTKQAENLLYTAVKLSENEGEVFLHEDTQEYFVIKNTWDGQSYDRNGEPLLVPTAIPCQHLGSYTGGDFKAATCIVNIDENLFFGTENGVVCSFNFDMREDDGSLVPKYYNFDNRTIYCGIATKMDNCGIPHLTKSTIKKSTVIKTKAMRNSAAKVRVRTNKDGYQSVARLNSSIFTFEDLNFSDFTFASQEQTVFALREKEKHWVEKQHWIYSDEYQKPFSVYYIAYRYKVSGRIKD